MPPSLFLSLILIVLVDTINVRSFSTQIQTSTISQMGNGNSGSSTATFITAKTNTLYKYAFSVQEILQIYKQDDYSLQIKLISLTTSQIKIEINSYQQNSISSIRLRYLIVQSSFTYLTTAHLFYSSTGFSLVSGTTIIQSVSLPSAMGLTSVVMSFINGWDIGQSTTDSISMFAKPTLVNALTVNVQISSSLLTACTLWELSVDILVYDIDAFKAAYNNQFFISGSNNTAISTSFTPFSLNINDNAYFVGIYALTMSNPNKDPIDFKLSFSASTIQETINNVMNTQEIFINYIQLQTIPNCIAPSVWNQTKNQCLNCLNGSYYNSSTNECTNCSSLFQYCFDCTSNVACNTCGYSLSFINNTCMPNCIIYPHCTSCSFSIAKGIACDNCTTGYGVSAQDQTLCVTICGDGIMMPNQQCDDGNKLSGDGCSASCIVEDYFNCTNVANSLSQCLLLELSISPVCIVKDQDSNSFSLVLELYPSKLGFYSWLDWSKGIQPNPLLAFVSSSYESQTSKVRFTFSYSASIQDLTNIITISVSQIASQLSTMTDKTVTLPQNTQNNQALQFFDDSYYKLAKVVRYVGYLIAALSLMMFLAGYFGTKLISIECIGVIQLAAMLVFSLRNTNPVMAALQSLSLSMGLTCLPKDYKYQPSGLSPHMKLLMLSNNIFDCENIFLMFLLCPLVLALVLKLLSEFKYKNKPSFKLAYKNSAGTFTFYAILLLAYGQVSYFVGNAKYFSSQKNNYLTLVITLLFIILMVVYFIGLIKYPRWFGSFKNKFQKYNICEYFYLFSTVQRLITPMLIVAVSPFKYVSLIVFPIFVGEAVFIAYKKPYLQDAWKRALANKIISAAICILFTIPAATQNQSYTQIAIALIIEIILLTVLSYSAYFTIKQFPQNMEQVKFKMFNAESKMELKDCQKKQLHDFAVKMIPTDYVPQEEDIQVDEIPTENEKSKFKGYWQNYYCHLYTGSILQNVLNMNRIHKQKSSGQNSISVEMKELNITKDIIQKVQ